MTAVNDNAKMNDFLFNNAIKIDRTNLTQVKNFSPWLLVFALW